MKAPVKVYSAFEPICVEYFTAKSKFDVYVFVVKCDRYMDNQSVHWLHDDAVVTVQSHEISLLSLTHLFDCCTASPWQRRDAIIIITDQKTNRSFAYPCS